MGDQFHVDSLGRFKIEKLQRDDEFGSVRIFPHAVAIRVEQSNLVKQSIGSIRIELRVFGGELRFVKHTGGMYCHLVWNAATEVNDLVHFFAVNGIRERVAKSFVPKEFAQLPVFVVVVELDRNVAGVQPPPDIHPGETVALAKFQQRNVLSTQRKRSEIQLTRGSLSGHEFGVVPDDLCLYSIDVGKLLAPGVDLMVVGIALETHEEGCAADRPVCSERWYINALLYRRVAQGAKICHPGNHAASFDSRVQFVAVNECRVPMLEIVFRINHMTAVIRDHIDEQWIGPLENVLKREIVNFDN